MSLNLLAFAAFSNAKSKGFHDQERSHLETMALVHSEVSEAVEAFREGKHVLPGAASHSLSISDDEAFKKYFKENVKDTYENELADILIRVFDEAGKRGIDLDNHVAATMRYNSMRPRLHGKRM